MTEQKGIFTISLDFELYWGIRDNRALGNYKKNLLGVRFVVPSLLKLFDEYNIHTTWAIVGILFFDNRQEIIEALPVNKPYYTNSKFFPYDHINNIGINEKEDPFHYAPSLIKMIISFPHQEIGSHTFSHYYCLQKGQDSRTFKDDLEAAVKIAKKYNLNIESLIFPRHQVNSEYISICRTMGIKTYRGNESFWVYSAKNRERQSLLRRGLRFLDVYFNISGHNCYSIDKVGFDFPFNIPSSRLLRPYLSNLSILEPLRLRRILSGLTYAAKKGLIYHLWWHPHNFGVNLDKNMLFLKKILNHYSKLRKIYGMQSLNMGEIARRLLNRRKNER